MKDHHGTQELPPNSASAKEQEKPCLVLKIDGKSKRLTPTQLKDDHVYEEVKEGCAGAAQPVDVSLVNLLDQLPEVRVDCIDLIASLKCNCKFHIDTKGHWHNDFLQAVLGLMADPSVNPDQYERAKSAALEWGVLRYPAAMEAPCQQILNRMRDLGVTGVSLRDVVRDARQIQHALGSQSTGGGAAQLSKPVRDIFDNAPVSEEIVVPAGWTLSQDGIKRYGEEAAASIPAPVLITERHVDINGNNELVTLAWRRDGEWRQHTVDRTVIANSRNIVDQLAALGGPVNSNNSKELVQYMADFETANLVHLPVTRVSRQLGWQGSGETVGFLCGKTLISAKTDTEAADTGNQTVRFAGADQGDDQIAAGFHQRGSLTKWKGAIAKISPFPKVRVALYASFVPPLLSIFKARNFVVDFSGKTTVGKTTSLRVAASVWGDPDDNNPAGLIKTWDGTATFRERVPAVLNHLPYFLDENKRVRYPEEVTKTIYSVVQGQGRGRGSIKGLARLDAWHTVLYTSGEQPATSFTKDGGTVARVLGFWGSPFEKVDAATRTLVRQLNEQLKSHYGHAGPRVVQYILDHRDQWIAWKKEYSGKVAEYEAMAGDNNFAGRMATDFAAIAVAGRIAHEALTLPWPFQDPIKPVWKTLAREAGEADRTAAALRYVMDWAYSHQEEFFCRRKGQYAGVEDKVKGKASEVRQPPGSGWAGRWDEEIPVPGTDEKAWTSIGFLPARLRAILQDGGFEPESIIRTWRDEGWLACTTEKKGKRFEVKVRVGQATAWLIAIKRAAVEKVGG